MFKMNYQWALIHVHFKQGLRQLRNWYWEGKETPWTDVLFALGKYFYWTSYLFLVFDPPRLLAMVTWMVNSLPGLVNAAANNEHSRPHQCQYHINVALFWNKHLFSCHLELCVALEFWDQGARFRQERLLFWDPQTNWSFFSWPGLAWPPPLWPRHTCKRNNSIDGVRLNIYIYIYNNRLSQ